MSRIPSPTVILIAMLVSWFMINAELRGADLVVDGVKEQYVVDPSLEMLTIEQDSAHGTLLHYTPLSDARRWFPTSSRLHWFRFTVDNRSGRTLPMILTNGFQMAQMVVVHPDLPLAPSWMGHIHNEQQYHPSLTPAARLLVAPGQSSYFLGVNSFGHPEILSLTLTGEQTFLINVESQIQYLLIVFGLLLGVEAYGLASLIGTRSRMQFIFLFLSINLTLFSCSLVGLATYFHLGFASFMLLNWLPMLSCTFGGFSWYILDFYEVNKKTQPRRYRILVTQSLLFALMPLVQWLNPTLGLVAFLSLGLYSGIVFSTVVASFYRRDRLLGLLFALGFFPIIGAFMFLGLAIVGFLTFPALMGYALFVLAVNDNFFVAIATGLRTLRLHQRTYQVEQAIILGKSVQDLLLPTAIEGKCHGFSYEFRYAPFKDSMSGDWIQSWQTENGDLSLMLGDVTGKGPQAAITVAAIAAIVNMYKGLKRPLDEEIIQKINSTLFAMFVGRITSTITALTIHPDHTVTLYNTGGQGWFLVTKNTARHFMLRSNLAGSHPFILVGSTSLTLGTDDLLFTVTDGVCEGGVGFKRMADLAAEINRREGCLKDYSNGLWSMSPNQADDRALILLHVDQAASPRQIDRQKKLA